MPGPDMNVWRRILADLDRPLPARRPASEAPLRPASFSLFSDPLDRYSFLYPSSWELRDGASPVVSSRTLGLFARVDFLPTSRAAKERLLERFPGLEFRAWRGGLPARGTGRFVDGSRAFAWTSWVFELKGTRLALSTGALEERGAPARAAYRRNTLAAVRRGFRLSSGALSKS